MILKYNLNIDNSIIQRRLQSLINQVYKLLPSRQQGNDWEKPLETILEELSGMQSLMDQNCLEIFFPLLNKLEGLHSLQQEDKFSCYRRIIFECLGLMNELKKKICHQNY